MEGHIRAPESGKHMLRVDMLINAQNTGRQCMNPPCNEMHTAGVNMDIHTWRGQTEILAQSVIQVIIMLVLIKMASTPVVRKLVTVISTRMVKNFLQPVGVRRPITRQ